MTLDYSAFDVNMKIIKLFTDDYGRHQRVEIQLLTYLAEKSYLGLWICAWCGNIRGLLLEPHGLAPLVKRASWLMKICRR